MKLKVLIIDDDPSILTMVEGILAANGYDVRATEDGLRGVEQAREWDPDLIVLDIMMPEVDGYTTARLIRGFSSTPIIFLSAKAEEEDILEGFEVGADDYIIKPFSAPELLARTRAVLRRFEMGRVKGHSHMAYDHGDLMIDFDRARVTVDGIEVNTSATEFKILRTLAFSKGKIISAQELMNSVWGHYHRYDKALLYVSMSRIKQKIEKDPKNPAHIQTIKGVGYVMPDINPDKDETKRT